MIVAPVQKSFVPEEEWITFLQNATPWLPPAKPTLVISPHPDDETLGAGGLIAAQVAAGVTVTVVAVTDGEAAYPDWDGCPSALAAQRRLEQNDATSCLGVHNSAIRLTLPDSRVAQHESELEQKLASLIRPDMLVVAPWENDWHPDHEACARVTQKLCLEQGAELISYLFWTWHRRTSESLQGVHLLRFELSPAMQTTKKSALNCHQSQLQHPSGEPILPSHFLAPAFRSFETFISHV